MRDDGVATIWAVGGLALLLGVVLIGLQLGAAVVARHRAEAAADLAALAAAALAVEGPAAACRRAGVIASAMGGTVAGCAVIGWDALVEVHVEVPAVLLSRRPATGRARAGPVASDPVERPVQ